MQAVVDHCLRHGANISPLLHAGGEPAGGCDAHQINITYYSALGEDDGGYLVARALQLFAPGIPQIYYVGLLAGGNDEAGPAATGDGRAINRHNYSVSEAEAALDRPVVQRLMQLIRLRNEHPAFQGELEVLDAPPGEVRLEWRQGEAHARLDVDLGRTAATVRYSNGRGGTTEERIG